MPKGKISRIKTRANCTEYKRLFDCAQRKGLIGGQVAIMPSLPSYLSTSDFVLMKIYSQLGLGGSGMVAILKPHAYCHKGPIPTASNGPFSHSLIKLRKYSGCAPRPSGSSSRFAPSPGKCIQPHCGKAPCPEICYDDQGNVIDNSSARRELKDFGTEVTDFLKGPKGIITIVALVVIFVLTKKI